ncbi:hypothetical protein H257_12792 [Aphanomyces astaci]|uniref:Uncharacterized protein n=1 Tax=Aphanomyces astaci TaxID=112090 RepID=W4FYV2_APHAT|nr:hypothetical protein H257_12792 [Aphanomyces astaci]ETV71979.1 hypothetical protein H257_12792 [Aphanomyces astaci]|eukprot:XP_009838422.1 hypothetical protein H257_12792 [Aphanomyces astaci]
MTPRVQEDSMQLTSVKFPSYTDLCRVQVDLSKGDVPSCIVTDTSVHAPKSASYVLPSAVVISILQVHCCKAQPIDSRCSVDLKDGLKCHVKMLLTLKAFGQLSAEYSFELAPLEVDAIEKLESMIRDLNEEIAVIANAPSPLDEVAELRQEITELRN